MSWEDFERYRAGQNPRQPKRRRLFPSNTVAKSRQKQENADIIASFDSDSDSEKGCKMPASGKQRMFPRNKEFKPISDKQKTASVKKSSSIQRCGIKERDRISAIQTTDILSPSSIDSFESDSSAQESTPPPRVKPARKNNPPAEQSVVTFPERVPVRTVKLGFEPKFDSSFSNFESKDASSFPEAIPIAVPLENIVCTPTKQSAAKWLKGIKSPDSKFKPISEPEDKSAKKLASRKHPVGGLAHKAQSMMRYNKGEYLLWLHKNIHSAPLPPFNSSCYFGIVTSTEVTMKYNLTAVQTKELCFSGRSVTVLIPVDKKCGEFKNGKVLVVFPEFHCFIKRSEYILVVLFHAQFFDKPYFDFESISKFDHFAGITETAESLEEFSNQCNTDEHEPNISIPNEISPCYPIDLHVCVYHVRSTDTHVQLLCCDAKDNLIIVEIPSYLARQSWDQMGLSVATTCYFTALTLQHVSLACLCFSWFPQLLMFKVGCQRKLYCFEMLSGSVNLLGNVAYVEELILASNRTDFIGKFLGSIPDITSGRSVCYFVSLFGTTQWIEYSSAAPPPFSKGECVKFSNLICLGPLSYKFDELSLVFYCFLNKALNITYPNLYSYANEEELKITEMCPPSLCPFNQYLPELSPCAVKLRISEISYTNKEFNVHGVACGVVVSLKLCPGTVRRYLGTNQIIANDLARLKGVEVCVNGVLVGKCRIVEHSLQFMENEDL